jgi:hypothetical protein
MSESRVNESGNYTKTAMRKRQKPQRNGEKHNGHTNL